MKRYSKILLLISNPILIVLMLLSSILIPISALSIDRTSSHDQAGTPEANLISLGQQLQPALITGYLTSINQGSSTAPTLKSTGGTSSVYLPILGSRAQGSKQPNAPGTEPSISPTSATVTLTPEGYFAPTPTITDTSNPNFTETLPPTQTQTLSNPPTQTVTTSSNPTTSSTLGKTSSLTIAPTTLTGQLCGEISKSIVLTLAGSPYVVSCDISIDSQTVITLEAGAIVKIAQGVNIVVNGTLFASAIPEQPVVFTSITDDTGGDTNGDGTRTSPTPGDWGTIQISPVGLVSLTFAVIHFGTNAINVNSGEADLDNVAILDNSASGITSSNGGRIFLSNSQVIRNPVGIKALGGTLSVNRSTISNNDQGIHVEGTPILTINHNSITNNNSYGIFNANSPSHIVAKNNWWGDPKGPKPYPNATANGVNFASHHDTTCNCDVVDDIFVDVQPWLTTAP